MQKNVLINSFVLIGSIVFYLAFWKEKMGLNVLLFSSLMIAFLYISKPAIRFNRTVLLTTLGTLITASLIVWNNSLMSKVVHLISFTTMIGLAKQEELKFPGYGFLLSLISFGETPLRFVRQFSQVGKNRPLSLAPAWRTLRLSVVPLLILLIFYGIYLVANPEFRTLSNSFWVNLIEWFSWNISIPQVLFFITSIFVASTILAKSDFPIFKDFQTTHKENLRRLHGGLLPIYKSMIALKNEFHSGLILLFSLNALLLIVNIIDIKNYWFGNSYHLPPYEMKMMVHQGTYFLIAGLLLAMVVISVLFRKNLNFFPNNKKLKVAGYLWIVQNSILAISLFIKNYRYIEANDLAYKRIGVLIFLFLVFAGLVTMILKIRDKKTFYFLLHRNAWMAYIVFICCSFVNWDIFISEYNLSRSIKTEIDYPFLISKVSDKNIYLLLDQEAKQLLPEQRQEIIHRAIHDKKEAFIKRQENLSWLSWNYADQKNLSYFQEQNIE